MYQGRFLILRSPDGDTWAEMGLGSVVIKRGQATRPEEGATVLTVPMDQLRRLVAWAEPDHLTVELAGPLARQIKGLARGVGLTPQNFALEALNAFIQAGEAASLGEPPSLPSSQDISFEL